MAVREAASKSHSAEGHTSCHSVCVHNGACRGVSDLDRPVVILVGDENVPIGQQLGRVRIVQLIGTDAGDTVLSVLPDNRVITDSNLNDAFVGLIGDEDTRSARETNRKVRVLDRYVQLVRSEPGDSELSVLPDDIVAPVNDEYTVVHATGFLAASCCPGW